MREHAMSAKQEMAIQAAAGTPPLGIVGLHIAGYPVADWAAGITIVYVLLQIVYLLPKIWDRYTGKEELQCDSSND